MGVKLLIRCRVDKGVVPGPQHFEVLQQLLTSLVVKPSSQPWLVNCYLLKQMTSNRLTASTNGLKELWCVTCPEYAETCYLVSRSEKRVLECDRAAPSLLNRRLEYRESLVVKFEGHTFLKGEDLVIRLVSVSQTLSGSQVFLGHFLELEYLPMAFVATDDDSAAAAAAAPILQSLVEILQEQLTVVMEQRQQRRRPKQASAGPSGGGGSSGGAAAGDTVKDEGGNDAFVKLRLEPLFLDFREYHLPSSAPFGRSHAAASYTAIAVEMSSGA